MDQKEIFQSLSSLEKSLSNISSASEMVKRTTKSCDDLQNQVKRYCEDLSSITTQLKVISRQLNGSSESLLADMDSRTNTILAKISSQSENLSKQVEDRYDVLLQRAEAQRQEAASRMDARAQAILKDVKAKQDALTAATGDTLSGSISAFDRDVHRILSGMEDQFSSQILNAAKRIDAEFQTFRKSLRDCVDTTDSLNSVMQTFCSNFSTEHSRLDDQLRRFDESSMAIKKTGDHLLSIKEEVEKQQKNLEVMAEKYRGITLWLIVLLIAILGCNAMLYFSLNPDFLKLWMS
ncbi:MAG: hypothetical protein PUB69_06630 [Desulfovibrionaceae bacterium]|nr:hypothetical protein [Desulfovibrionaceae bacterium]